MFQGERFLVEDDDSGNGVFVDSIKGLQGRNVRILKGYSYHEISFWQISNNMNRCERLLEILKAGAAFNIYLINSVGQKLSSYFIFSMNVISARKNMTYGALEIKCAGVMLSVMPKFTMDILSDWDAGRPKEAGAWERLSYVKKNSWLELVRQYSGLNNSNVYDCNFHVTDKVLNLNGELISDYPSFYCAIGEAAYGPGGYLGGNVDGLYDCLMELSGGRASITLNWFNSSLSIGQLGRESIAKDYKYFKKRKRAVFDYSPVEYSQELLYAPFDVLLDVLKSLEVNVRLM